MYQLKSVARRIGLLLPVLGILSAVSYQAILPGISAADALNPLTKRSLLLTSSSPGWAYTDGSGNSTYAPPGSGPNGKQTGQTFTFDTSSTASIKGFSLQYCTTAAGLCLAPGDDSLESGATPAGSAPFYTDDTSHTDFNVVTGGAATTSGTIASPLSGWSEGGSVVSNTPTTTTGDFQVYTKTGSTWAASSGWTMDEANLEDSGVTDPTGANNYIQLINTSGASISAGQEVEVQFQPSTSNYITNPGSNFFFVKIDDYSDAGYQNFDDNYPYTISGTAPNETCGTDTGLSGSSCPVNVVDGGVTVAQVMNQSIEIQTKVLETMSFSVGTVDPDTLSNADLSTDTSGVETAHGECDPILGYNAALPTGANPSNDTLLLGDDTAEYSLSTIRPYDSNSLWRVSTNAANGATVYYSGETLSDTEGNQIQAMTDSPTADDAAYADSGTEQFGLGLEYAPTTITNAVDQYLGQDNETTPGDITTAQSDEVPYTGGLNSAFNTDLTSNSSSPYWYAPTLSPLLPTDSYGDANGTLASGSGPKFAFNANADTVPVPIATEDVQVVNCSTGDVRYVADIAPSTPAGIYTTAINYLAAPEY